MAACQRRPVNLIVLYSRVQKSLSLSLFPYFAHLFSCSNERVAVRSTIYLSIVIFFYLLFGRYLQPEKAKPYERSRQGRSLLVNKEVHNFSVRHAFIFTRTFYYTNDRTSQHLLLMYRN